MKRIGLRVSDELLGEIEAARGLVPRERWIREQLQRAVDSPGRQYPKESRQAANGTPEQYRQGYGPDVTRLRSSGQAKAGVKPITK